MKDEEKNGLKTDPVCRMTVREEEAVTADCDGVVYYFCSEGCRDKFLKERTCARTAYDLPRLPWRPGGTCCTCGKRSVLHPEGDVSHQGQQSGIPQDHGSRRRHQAASTIVSAP